MKLDNEPRLSSGPTLFQSLIDWARKVAQAVNQNTDTLATKAPINSPVFTGDPQAPTPASTDNDTSIATTAWCKFGFVILKATNGYIKFPTWLGGLVIQWNTIATSAANTAVTWTFPVAFPTACIGTWASTQSGTGGGYWSYIGPPGLTSTYAGCTFPGAANTSCLAIGY